MVNLIIHRFESSFFVSGNAAFYHNGMFAGKKKGMVFKQEMLVKSA